MIFVCKFSSRRLFFPCQQLKLMTSGSKVFKNGPSKICGRPPFVEDIERIPNHVILLSLLLTLNIFWYIFLFQFLFLFLRFLFLTLNKGSPALLFFSVEFKYLFFCNQRFSSNNYYSIAIIKLLFILVFISFIPFLSFIFLSL